MPFWRGAPFSLPHISLFLLVWLSPIYVAMAYDYFRQKIVHPVYVIGLVTLSLFRLRNPVKETETWLSISGWLASFYM